RGEGTSPYKRALRLRNNGFPLVQTFLKREIVSGKEEMMEKIITNLWFDDEAEEAANFYTSIFKNSRVIATTLTPKSAEEVSGKRAGSVMFVEFELDGERFIALNGGPEFKFNESVSLMVPCEDQAEVD